MLYTFLPWIIIRGYKYITPLGLYLSIYKYWLLNLVNHIYKINYLFGTNFIIGHIISSKDIPPCWKVSLKKLL